MDAPKPIVIVFTWNILPYSQTFIKDHVESLVRYDYQLVGCHEVAGLETDPARTRILRFPGLGRLGKYLLALTGRCRELDDLVAQRKPVLIHAHFALDAIYVARYALRRGLPLIVTLHGYDVTVTRPDRSLHLRALLRICRPILLRHTRLFLPVSEFLRKESIRLGYPPDRNRTHYLGTPLDELIEMPCTPVSGRILFIGRLVPKKGCMYLLNAVKVLKERGVAAEVVIAGDGEELETLREFTLRHDLPVEFRGALPREQVHDELARAWLFCMPSTQAANGDNEGLGLVYVEAQAAGIPVVAFDQGPVPEAVLDGQTGLLVPDRDIVRLADALERLLSDSELRDRFSRRARSFVEERFDLRRQSASLESIYDDVIAS